MSDWEDFQKAVLTKIAASVDVPFSDLKNDLGNVENSIIRVKLLTAWRKSRAVQTGYIDPVKCDAK